MVRSQAPATAKKSPMHEQPAHGRLKAIGTSHEVASARRSENAEYRAERVRLTAYEDLARLVLWRRQALGLSQQQLSKRMGTSHSAISRIEGGRHATSVETLRRLAAALDSKLVVGFVDSGAEGSEEAPHLVSFG